MKHKTRLLKKLNTLQNTFTPEGSFAARLQSLSSEELSVYMDWKKRHDLYQAQFKGEDVYRLLLGQITTDKPAPHLRESIHDKLYPPRDPNVHPYEQYQRLLEEL